MLMLEELHAQGFSNPGFETSGTCSATNCAHEDISCIDDWWNFHPNDSDEFAWFSYDCNSVSSCGDERGILIAGGEVAVIVEPTTENPFYEMNDNAVYNVYMDVLTLEYSAGGFYVGIYGSNSQQEGDLDLFGVYNVPDPHLVKCKSFQIGLDMSLDETEAHITDYPYIIFKLTKDDPRTTPPSTIPTLIGVLDGLALCTLLDVSITHENCDEICIEVDIDPDCGVSGQQIEDCTDCSFEVQVVAHEEVIYEEVIDPLNESFQLCFPTDGQTDFEISYYYNFNIGETQFNKLEIIEYSIQCSNETVSTTTTWTTTNVPNGGRMDELVVESGATLTIQSDVVLSFCPGGKLIIEPNAEVKLYGTLTSACNEGWEGVKVYGNSAYSQYYDLPADEFHQGSLRGYPGSVIENAWTAVELFGPDADDTGGRIKCEGTFFLNNRFGVKFKPYVNWASNGQPRPYLASFRNCIFTIDNDYILEDQFVMHIRLDGVNGVLIHGTDFENLRDLADP